MKLFARKEHKRKNTQNFMTAMKDIAGRADAADKTGVNDPLALFERLSEACYVFTHVNGQHLADEEDIRLAYTAVDKVLGQYHPGDGLIEMRAMRDIVCVPAATVPGCDFQALPERYAHKIKQEDSKPAVV